MADTITISTVNGAAPSADQNIPQPVPSAFEVTGTLDGKGIPPGTVKIDVTYPNNPQKNKTFVAPAPIASWSIDLAGLDPTAPENYTLLTARLFAGGGGGPSLASDGPKFIDVV